jgi:hypothetical protein
VGKIYSFKTFSELSEEIRKKMLCLKKISVVSEKFYDTKVNMQTVAADKMIHKSM